MDPSNMESHVQKSARHTHGVCDSRSSSSFDKAFPEPATVGKYTKHVSVGR